MPKWPSFKALLFLLIICIGLALFINTYREKQALKKIIERLSSDTRVAEVLVTDIGVFPNTKKTYTTIKFVEYDTKLKPLEPKYFTFSENIIQFQSLVIRFDDFYVKRGHPLKGKSAYIFMKAFAFTEDGVEVFEINKVNSVPSGYKIEGAYGFLQEAIWRKFWDYALDSKKAKHLGVKNAQIEAPGTKFIPGMIYTIKIEHDGGLRIDAKKLPGSGNKFILGKEDDTWQN